MNAEYLKRMSASELNAYAKNLGINLSKIKNVDDKVAEILKRRNRQVSISVLGVEITVSVKRLRDKRFTDVINKQGISDDELEAAMRGLIGDDQYNELVKAATEDDGLLDVDALGYAINTILRHPELKNF